MILTEAEELQFQEFQTHYDMWGPQRKQTWRYYDNPEAYWTAYPSSGYPPIPEKSENVAWGVDMSGYWNGVADWSIARDTGCKFAIIKACDGTVTTRNFYANIEGAQKAGIEVLGAYFWLYRNVRLSGNLQANAWWNAVKSLGLKILMADFEWTYWNGVQDNPNTDDLYGVVIPFEQLSGKKMMIYSAPGYFSTYFNHAPMWAAYPLCIAHYGVLQPAPVAPWGNNWKMWQLTDRWPGLPLGLDPAVSKASDGDIYHGTIDQFNQEYSVTVPVPPPDEPDAYIVRRPLSEYDLETEVGWDATGLPLLSAVEAAQKYGWEVCMNGGAGFDYSPDWTRGIPITEGSPTVPTHNGKMYVIRPAVVNGVVPDLVRNSDYVPWCIYGRTATEHIFIATRLLEMNELKACQFAQSLGILDAWVLDSDRSTQIEENNTMLYWPYGDEYAATHPGYTAERVPQHIGLRKKGATNVATVKGTCRLGLVANVKNLVTGTIVAQMKAGDVVYGDLSAAGTDIINFTEFTRADGSLFRLDAAKKYKVSCTNLTVENVSAPPPVEPPPSDDTFTVVLTDNATGEVWKGTLVKQ